MSPDKVVAVIVTYRPELVVLFELLDSLRGQVSAVVIVDNGSPATFLDSLRHRLRASEHLIEFGNNRGIAAAQNRGIEEAKLLGATHLALFDHDSNPGADMIPELLNSCRDLQSQGHKVAAIGPYYVDPRQGDVPVFVAVRGFRLRRLKRGGETCVPVDHVIASGTLIPVNAFDAVGEMNEALFIDYVDIEWCLRARSKGFGVFGCYAAKMFHSLGDEPVVFRGKARPVRSPVRHYYMFRNAMILYRMKHVPFDWKVADALHCIPRFGFYALFAKPRLQQLKMMSLGLWHGLIGRTGPFVP
jgi:rhamnosyltransferase